MKKNEKKKNPKVKKITLSNLKNIQGGNKYVDCAGKRGEGPSRA